MGSAPRLRCVCLKPLGVIFLGASQMNKCNLALVMVTPYKSDHYLVKAESCSFSSQSWFLAAGKYLCGGVSLHQRFCSDFCQISRYLVDVFAVKFSPPPPSLPVNTFLMR